jgi:hypothetical protein
MAPLPLLWIHNYLSRIPYLVSRSFRIWSKLFRIHSSGLDTVNDSLYLLRHICSKIWILFDSDWVPPCWANNYVRINNEPLCREQCGFVSHLLGLSELPRVNQFLFSLSFSLCTYIGSPWNICIPYFFYIGNTTVPDLWQFGTDPNSDPDPLIRTFD